MNDEPAEGHFEPTFSFGIDDGELDGLTPQQCFVLGYELAQIASLSRKEHPFSRPVHCQNQDRIRRLMESEGRTYALSWMAEDVSESWMWLEVK